MRPFQLWLPVVEYSPTEAVADKDRAFSAWRRESRVWVLRSVDEPMRWQDGPGWWSWHLAVPAFDLRHVTRSYPNCIDIFYIENGQVGGPGGTRRFPGGCSADLLMAWLNLELASIEGEDRETPEPFTLWAPNFDGSDVTYREESFGYENRLAAVSAEMLDEAHALWEEAPPDRSSSSSATSRPKHSNVEDWRIESLEAIIQCPQRLNAMPYSPSFFEDMVSTQKQMADIARKCEKDPISAVREAGEAAIPYISEGRITQGEYWLWRKGPALWKMAKGDESTAFKLLLDDAQQYNKIKAKDLKKAMQSGKWPGTLGQLTSIRRAWGMVGLFWALFLEHLEQYRFQQCSWCSNIISGKQGKKNCAFVDNKVCFRERRAHDKRTSRARGSQEQQDS